MCIETLAGAIDDLGRRGFTAHLSVVGNQLRVAASGKSFPPTDVVIREHRRFEGVSDPDDMAILYALEVKGGVLGTLVDAYGVYADPLISDFMAAVPDHGEHR
jgi:hypothetical protein